MGVIAEHTTGGSAKANQPLVPVVVDLDGTLVKSDLLIEAAFAHLGRRPAALPGMAARLSRGKAAFKHWLAELHELEPRTLPYDEGVLGYIAQCKAEGRLVFLASASSARFVAAVADYLGLFDGWFASDRETNLSGHAKAACLLQAFGAQGFDYVGNRERDLEVWRHARTAVTIRASDQVLRRLSASDRPVVRLETPRQDWRAWIELLRVHQYAKNALVLVPLLTAHAFTIPAFVTAALTIVAFSLTASSVYVLNDLVDVAADRGHPSKRTRPLACGAIQPSQAIAVVPLLLIAGLSLAAAISLPVLGVVASYLAITTAYTFYIKRKLILDVVTLALLYTVRVIGGAVAIDALPISPWLLAFSLFIFTSLALLKRYIELVARIDGNLADASNRNYRKTDAPVIVALSAAAALNAITVLTLYMNSTQVAALYRRPEFLWLLCPLLIYWIGRAIVLAHRRVMQDDPIVFALRDNISRYTVICMVAIVAISI